jgi:hypothetical protein
MREDLKNHTLSFIEIAKLVGKRWQALPSHEREHYEQQANAAKDVFHRLMVAYKKTPDYHRYEEYLADFKLKQSKQSVHGEFQGFSCGIQKLLISEAFEPSKKAKPDARVDMDRSISSSNTCSYSDKQSLNHEIPGLRAESVTSYRSLSSAASHSQANSPLPSFSSLTSGANQRDSSLTSEIVLSALHGVIGRAASNYQLLSGNSNRGTAAAHVPLLSHSHHIKTARLLAGDPRNGRPDLRPLSPEDKFTPPGLTAEGAVDSTSSTYSTSGLYGPGMPVEPSIKHRGLGFGQEDFIDSAQSGAFQPSSKSPPAYHDSASCSGK